MQIPLPSTIKGLSVSPRQQEYLVNYIRIGNTLACRPGCELVTSVSGTPRGMFVYNDELYSIFGTTLYKGTDLAQVGTVAGSGKVDFAPGFSQGAIVTGGTNYILSSVGALSTNADPDLPACQSVARIDGRFIYIPSDGSAALFSDVSSPGVVGALSSFNAEALPDKNSVVDNIRNDAFIGGADSFERFRNRGSADAPFLRADGSVIDVGYVSAKIHAKDSMLFVGKDRESGYAIYILAEGRAEEISDAVINERLNSYTDAQLQSIEAQRFSWRGQDCFCFSLPDVTLVYSGGGWSYFDSGIKIPYQLGTWDYKNATLFKGKWYIQKDDGLYVLSSANTDNGSLFSSRIRTFVRQQNNDYFSIRSIELDIAQGRTASGSAGLFLSRDGEVWSDGFYVKTGEIGDHERKLHWSAAGGIGQVQGFLGLIISCTDDIDFNADNLMVRI